MAQSSRIFLVLAAVTSLLWGCSPSSYTPFEPWPSADGGSSSDGGFRDAGVRPDGGGLPLESACSVLNASQCLYLQRCGLIDSGDEALNDCEGVLTVTRCGPTRWPARAAAGTLQYHPANALLCADAWATHACADFEREPRGCEDVTSPAAALGGRCYGGVRTECIEGVCTGGTCPRLCRTRGDVGELCEETDDCKAWLYCRKSAEGSALGACTAFGSDGAECEAHQPCAKGFVCGSFSRCEPAAVLGAPCSVGTCTEDAWCQLPGSGPGACVARGNEGAACASDDQCRPDVLCRAATGTCEPRTDVPEDQTCSRRQSCASGLTCVGTAGDESSHRPAGLGVCTQGRLLNAPCTSSWDCEAPMACAMTGDADGGLAGRCGPRLDDGDRCEATRDCSVLSGCVAGTCVRLPQPGQPCPDGACLYGACEAGSDGGFVCKGPGGPNAACAENDDCASLRCVSGRCLAACTP